jgi:hypothetical protein
MLVNNLRTIIIRCIVALFPICGLHVCSPNGFAQVLQSTEEDTDDPGVNIGTQIFVGLFGNTAQMMPLITHYQIRDEIELSMEQHDDLLPHIEAWRDVYKPAVRGESEDQTKWIKILDKILLPHQMERLEQIHWQAMGLNALSSPHFAERVGATREEIANYHRLVKTIDKQAAKAREEAIRNGSTEIKFVTDLQNKVESQVKSLLPEEKWKKFAELKGKKFNLEGLKRRR